LKPTLPKAAERLEVLGTPDGAPLPPNTLAEMRRDMARLRLVREQIREIEARRRRRLAQASENEPHAMLARVVVSREIEEPLRVTPV
jgi:transposase